MQIEKFLTGTLTKDSADATDRKITVITVGTTEAYVFIAFLMSFIFLTHLFVPSGYPWLNSSICEWIGFKSPRKCF